MTESVAPSLAESRIRINSATFPVARRYYYGTMSCSLERNLTDYRCILTCQLLFNHQVYSASATSYQLSRNTVKKSYVDSSDS